MIKLLNNSCGVAEYRNTYRNTADTLAQYTVERKKTDPAGYARKPHTFVVFTFTSGQSEDFVRFVARKRLGKAIRTKEYHNINHGGKWNNNFKGTLLSVCVFIPDHEALTKWYQKNQDKNYTLD